MHIAYYITGHGYGHAIRSATIANCFTKTTKVTFRTTIPDNFFKRELQREYFYLPAEFDCGCIQSNGITVDIDATLKYYKSIALHNIQLLDREVAFCRKEKIDGIVSDIPSFVHSIAEASGIPSIAVTNFTWYDIYQEYLSYCPEFESILSEIQHQYQKANLLLALAPALPMQYFPVYHAAPIVGRHGKNRRTELMEMLQITDRTKKLGLIYLGELGLADAPWKKIESFFEWEFLGILDLPGAPENYHKLDLSCISYPDIIASTDCVIAKLGYGVVSECMINSTPLMFLSRQHFAEYQFLEKAVREWGGGRMLSVEQFMEIDWDEALHQLPDRKSLPLYSTEGARYCAEVIENFIANFNYNF